MLSVAFAYFINWNGDGLALQWAFLIVFGAYLLIAALLGFIGIRKVKKVRASGEGHRPGERGQADPQTRLKACACAPAAVLSSAAPASTPTARRPVPRPLPGRPAADDSA